MPFLKQFAAHVVADNCTQFAAAVAYYLLFSLFPFLLFLLSLLAYLPVPRLQEEIMGWLRRVAPREALELVETNIPGLLSEQKGGLLSTGVVLTLIGAAEGMDSLITALNRVYNVRETRNFFIVKLTSVGLVVAVALLIVVAALLLIFGDQIEKVVSRYAPGTFISRGWGILRWGTPVVFMLVAVATVYHFGPAAVVPWSISWGSAFAVGGFIAASAGFSWFVNRFSSYSKSYGSIGAVIVLLTWLYVTALMIILGAEIDTTLATTGVVTAAIIPNL